MLSRSNPYTVRLGIYSFSVVLATLLRCGAQRNIVRSNKQKKEEKKTFSLDGMFSITSVCQKERLVMVTTRVELATLALLAPRSNQLS